MLGFLTTKKDREENRKVKWDNIELRDSLSSIRATNSKLERKLSKIESKYEEKIEELKEEYEGKLNRKDERIEVLESLQLKSVELQKREIELDTKEAVIASQADSVIETQNELNRKKEVNDAEQERIKQSYYADGLADGLRKAHEITAEDRKQTAQIAALAAASHTPKAAEQIAQSVAKNLLPSGKVNEDESEDA